MPPLIVILPVEVPPCPEPIPAPPFAPVASIVPPLMVIVPELFQATPPIPAEPASLLPVAISLPVLLLEVYIVSSLLEATFTPSVTVKV